MLKLAINRCPAHGYWSVSIDGEHSGTRITPGKCCGRWEVIKEWPLDEGEWRAIVTEIDCGLEETSST